MLSEEQLEIISEAIQPLFQHLEHEIIVDIARRIKKTLTYTRTAELQAMSMRELGYSPSKIRSEAMKMLNADPNYRKMVAKNTLEYKREIKKTINNITKEAYKANNKIVADAGNMSWVDDFKVWKQAGKELQDNSYLHQLTESFSKQTEGELKNLTRTTGFRTMSGLASIENAYRNELDKGVIKICSGTFSADKVLRDVVRDLAHSGLRSIDFNSGYSMQLDTASRLALRTGCHQLSGKISDKNMEQTGENLVYVSRHWGARNKDTGHANHEQWQGKVYYVRPGTDYTEEIRRIGQERITDLWYSTGYSVDGAHENDPSGLDGYNCRHNRHVWFEGVSTFPKEDPEPVSVTINGKTYDYYAMTKRMRSMERAIRALKREEEALKTLGMDTTEIKTKLKQKTAQYKDFCKQCSVPEKTTKLRYEPGSSDLKKTKAWQDYEKEKGCADAEGKRYYQVAGSNDVFAGHGVQKRVEIADDIIKELTDRDSRWNGIVRVNGDIQGNGVYRSDGTIEFKSDNPDNRTVIHEVLHSRSAPYIPFDKKRESRMMEETSVEYLAREICKKEDIPFSYVEISRVNALMKINQIMDIDSNDYNFAKLVYNISPGSRLSWLEGKADRFAEKNPGMRNVLKSYLNELR